MNSELALNCLPLPKPTQEACRAEEQVDYGREPLSVYHVLAQHQREESWGKREVVSFLQAAAEEMNREFKLNIPKLALCVDRLPANVFGHFRYGHNGFGLEGEIAINSRYLPPDRPLWQVLGTLLHEMVHAWQAVHGRPGNRWHHNAEFRAKGRQLGLNIDAKGATGYSADSRFKDLVRRMGIEVPDGEFAPAKEKPRGESKLKKWRCSCGTVARVAIEDFRAKCLKCDSEFVRDNVRGDKAATTTAYAITPD